ncbi:hypothetical protein FPOA_03499 [Fusarium poae]|uniref:Uncharacterized protein n=1 Tax=Fusarium poae TaxID=36050 RepID=A0A1B8BA14_FUSPO|nr:hypothetical protein FPOA_03499 [Fusarium poae]
MGSTATNVNDQFNQQWFNLMNRWAGPASTSDFHAVFPCSKSTLAPVAGNGVPEAVTNYALYQIADNLVTYYDKWFTPGSGGSYFQSQVTYFNHIKLGAEAAMAIGQTRAANAATNYFQLKAQAFKEWEEFLDEVPTDFNTFLVRNRRDVLQAQSEMSAASAQVQSRLPILDPEDAVQVCQIKSCFDVVSQNHALPRCSFEASTQPFDIQYYIEELQNKSLYQAKINPASSINLPSYTLSDNYPTILHTMYQNATIPNANTIPKHSFTITTESSSSQVSNGTNLPWLRFHDGFSKNWTASTVNSTAGQITVDIAIKAVNTIDISPGFWDVPNYQQQFPLVDPSIPTSVKNTFKPVGMLIGSGLTITITFGGETNNAFSQEYTSVKQNYGGFSVFGITIEFEESPGNMRTKTHNSSYDNSTGVLTISPTPQLGTAMLLAVIGKNTACA